MININLLNINQLARVYIMANTPNYLYRHFKNDLSVIDFAKKSETKDLTKYIKKINKTKVDKRKEKDIITVYAAIIALCYKSINEAEKLLFEDVNTILWADSVIKLFIAQNTSSTNAVNVDYPYPYELGKLPVLFSADNVIVDGKK